MDLHLKSTQFTAFLQFYYYAFYTGALDVVVNVFGMVRLNLTAVATSRMFKPDVYLTQLCAYMKNNGKRAVTVLGEYFQFDLKLIVR